jgi:hypothetical protein
MPNAQDLIGRARMFQARAEQALDPISRQHYLEMAAHYRVLAVEHQETKPAPIARDDQAVAVVLNFMKPVRPAGTLVPRVGMHTLFAL